MSTTTNPSPAAATAVPLAAPVQPPPGHTLRYPGPELPGLPSFELDVPPGWHVIGAPGLLAVLTPQEIPAGFTPTLTVTGDTVAPGSSPHDLLERGLAAARGDYHGAEHAVSASTGVLPDDGGLQVVVASGHLRLPLADGAVEQVLTVAVTATSPRVWHALSVASTWRPAERGGPVGEDRVGPVLRAAHASFRLTRGQR